MDFIKQIKNTEKLTNQDTKLSLGLKWYIFKTDLLRKPGFYQANKIYWNVRNFLFPQQKWVLNRLPNSFIDIDFVLEAVILESIVQLVEKQDYFNVVESNDDFGRQLKKYYNDVKIVLPNLEKELEVAWERSDNINDVYDIKYKEVNKLELKIEKLKEEIMIWVVKNRRYFWT
jgi:hypothetical protein